MKRIAKAWIKRAGFKQRDPWVWNQARDWACAYHDKDKVGYLITIAYSTGMISIEVLQHNMSVQLQSKEIA